MADSEAQKIVDMLAESLYSEFAKAELDRLIYGMGFFVVTEDGIKHVPIGELDEYCKHNELLPPGDDTSADSDGGAE